MFRGSVVGRSPRSPFEHAAPAAAVLLREGLVDRISVEYAGEADEELLDKVELLLLPRLLRLRLEVAPLPLQLDGGRRHAARVPSAAVLEVGPVFSDVTDVARFHVQSKRIRSKRTENRIADTYYDNSFIPGLNTRKENILYSPIP